MMNYAEAMQTEAAPYVDRIVNNGHMRSEVISVQEGLIYDLKDHIDMLERVLSAIDRPVPKLDVAVHHLSVGIDDLKAQLAKCAKNVEAAKTKWKASPNV